MSASSSTPTSVHSVSTPLGIQNYIKAALARVEKTEVLPLSSTADALIVLNDIWKVLDSPALPGAASNSNLYVYRNQLRRLSVKIAIRYNIFPAALILTGVRCDDRDQRAGGGFADVFCGSYGETKVALKRLRPYAMKSERYQQTMQNSFYREALLWKHLNHENVVQFLGVSEDVFAGSFCMVIPWKEKGSVRHYIETQRRTGDLVGGNFVTVVDTMMYQTALGLQYLHGEGIVHGDLHAGNILVDDSGSACLTDFGMALVADATGYSYGSIHGGGASRWKAPELIDPDAFGLESTRPTYPSDVYSYALTCIEVYTGEPPLSELNELKVQRRVIAGTRPERPNNPSRARMSDSLWDLLQACWVQNPSERPSIQHVVQSMSVVVKESSVSNDDATSKGPSDEDNGESGFFLHDLTRPSVDVLEQFAQQVLIAEDPAIPAQSIYQLSHVVLELMEDVSQLLQAAENSETPLIFPDLRRGEADRFLIKWVSQLLRRGLGDVGEDEHPATRRVRGLLDAQSGDEEQDTMEESQMILLLLGYCQRGALWSHSGHEYHCACGDHVVLQAEIDDQRNDMTNSQMGALWELRVHMIEALWPLKSVARTHRAVVAGTTGVFVDPEFRTSALHLCQALVQSAKVVRSLNAISPLLREHHTGMRQAEIGFDETMETIGGALFSTLIWVALVGLEDSGLSVTADNTGKRDRWSFGQTFEQLVEMLKE